jgi:hypothetical protein
LPNDSLGESDSQQLRQTHYVSTSASIPVIASYVQPAILFTGSTLVYLALFVLEGIAVGVGFIAVVRVALKVFG